MSEESKRLSFADLFKVSEFLRTNEERWKVEKPTYAALIRIVYAQTGIKVAIRRLQEICKTAGVKWDLPSDSRTPDRTKSNSMRVLLAKIDATESLIKELTARIQTLENQVTALRDSHNAICNSLGEPTRVTNTKTLTLVKN